MLTCSTGASDLVSRGIGAMVQIEYDLDEAAIDALSFEPMANQQLMTRRESLATNYTDGIRIPGAICEEVKLGSSRGQATALAACAV